jgi:DNA-binding CsgD family transcriptional regulator
MAEFDFTHHSSSNAELVGEIARLKTQFDAFRFMKRLTESYRARAFIVFNLPPSTSFELRSNTIITNWPAELITAYDQDGQLSSSPLLQRLRTSTVPFYHDATDPKNRHGDGRPSTIVTMLERFRMQRCAHLPTHNASGERGCVSISGDREEFSQKEMSELSYLAIHVFERLGRIHSMDMHVTEMLTDREIDCLSWTAAGKTSVEIADIVGLSEHTVNQYLNRATKKLDTVNRTQAVAKALRVGIIK